MPANDDQSSLKRIVRNMHYPIAVALVVGLLLAILTTKALESKLEAKGRIEMQSALTLTQANLSVETVRAKGMGVASLMGLNEPILKNAALGKYKQDDPTVLKLLSIPRKHFNFEGLYVIDKTGVMVDNETLDKKSTGKSISFRPYFQQAIQGKESVYVAVGTNSDTRGIYYAAPLYETEDKRSSIIGVIGIKVSAEFLDNMLKQFGDDSMLISPQGVTYAATRSEWLWTLTPPFSEERVTEIRKLKQFGTHFDTKNPNLLAFNPNQSNVWLNNDRFAVERISLDINDPEGDWTLVRLKQASQWYPLKNQLATATIIMLIALLIGLLWQRQRSFRISTNHKLMLEIAERKQAEDAVLETAQRSAAISELNASLREAETLAEFSQRYFSGLVKLLNIRYGLLYVADDDNHNLVLCGGYGIAESKIGQIVPYGNGLAGQCALDQQKIQFDLSAQDYIRIVSGTGEAKPSYLLVCPLIQNGVTVAVVELAGLGQLPEKHSELLIAVEPVAAACISIITRKQQFHDTFMKQLDFQQALIDNIPNPIFYKGTDTRFLGCNHAYERAFNVRKQDFIGKRVLDLEYIPYQERLIYQQEDEGVIASLGTVKRIVQLRFEDGRLRNCIYSVSAIQLPNSVKGGLVGTFIDIDIGTDINAGIDDYKPKVSLTNNN